MPIYGFTCQGCNHHFEEIRLVSQVDNTPPVCEHCGSPDTARKLGTAMAVIGSGANRRVIGGNSCGPCASQSPSACSGCSNKH